MLTQFHNLTFT